MVENRLFNIHYELNNFNNIEREITYKHGLNQINVTLSINQILQCIERSKIVDYSETIMTDYRGFLFYNIVDTRL